MSADFSKYHPNEENLINLKVVFQAFANRKITIKNSTKNLKK